MATSSVVQAKTPGTRLASLDVFRGVTIAAMILVNNPGNDHAFGPLKHSEWNGWTMTDLIFPFFLFMVGVSLVLSTASRIGRGESKQRLALHAVRRAVIIFAIGLFIYGFPHFAIATWRIPGVLQRIAVCYLISALLYLWTGPKVRWAVIVGCLLGYWVLMRFLTVPGFGVPGVDIPLLHPDNNLAAWLDRKLMMGHLYEGVRDPEGLLSTLPAIATCLLGVVAGEWVREFRAHSIQLLRRLLMVGVVCFILGEAWGLFFPINKKLWTSSYVLLTAGLAMLALAACHWLLDVRGWKGKWTIPAIVFGTNAIVAYVFSELLATVGYSYPTVHNGQKMSWQQLVYSELFAKMSPAWGSLVFSFLFVLVCFVPVWVMYRKKVFVKV
ncbi:MAG TPA: heparan-alpha-glucosaminide N-acetyltransferase domain-containing protein [Terriglobales bacterium]|nr:heparan-alpha-glucosaminide N-acetyltransferase domain-containing protein [Terriglobales bacterium]